MGKCYKMYLSDVSTIVVGQVRRRAVDNVERVTTYVNLVQIVSDQRPNPVAATELFRYIFN